MLCPTRAFRLRIAFEALSDVAMPEDLLPANASLSDPSGWPAVVGQLGRLIAVQRRQFEQLTQQLAAASARMSSSSCKEFYSLFARELPPTRSRWHA